MSDQPERKTMPLPIGVALGILLAAAVLAVIVGAVMLLDRDDPYDCAMDNADRAMEGKALKDCPE